MNLLFHKKLLLKITLGHSSCYALVLFTFIHRLTLYARARLEVRRGGLRVSKDLTD